MDSAKKKTEYYRPPHRRGPIPGCQSDTGTLPLNVPEKKTMYMPPEYENFKEREEWKTSGKWLIYDNGDLQKMGQLWVNLRPLVEDGTLICAKSTIRKGHLKRFGGNIIMCYTPDHEDRRAVKKAADAIRRVTSEVRDIYYKTNEATDAGKSKKFGCEKVTKYKHTVEGSLYERQKNGGWQKLTFE